MILKQREAVEAYKAVLELGMAPLPYRKAREVAALRRRLQEEYETAEERELQLAEELGLEVVDKTRVRTKDPIKQAAFLERREAQMEEAAEIDLPAVDLSDFTNILQISANGLEALEKIVKFE